MPSGDGGLMPEDQLEMGGNMKAKGISDDIKQKADDIIEEFNQKTFSENDCFYQARLKGKYLYLDRSDYGNLSPICRLTYTGSMNRWEFAIFKWSSKKYDPEEGLRH